jgi:spore maturation protein CgeB
VTPPTVLLIARFDDARHAHAAQRRRALERLGCAVRVVEAEDRVGLVHRVLGRDRRALLLRAFGEASPDVVLVIGAPELEDDLLAEARRVHRATWINWFPDDLRTVEQAASRAAGYDALYAIGSDVAERLGAALSRPVEVLPLAADPSVYRPRRSRDTYRANVVFAGTATPRREALLAGLVEFGLALWGPGWRSTALRDYCRGELLQTEEYVKAYNGATVAVNIHHRADGLTEEACCNQRLFELAAMGTAQVVDHRADLPRYFEPGRDLLVYRTAEELRALVREVLTDPAIAQQLGESARRTALAEHTYMHRTRSLLEKAGLGVA